MQPLQVAEFDALFISAVRSPVSCACYWVSARTTALLVRALPRLCVSNAMGDGGADDAVEQAESEGAHEQQREELRHAATVPAGVSGR
jgi:hypothetical protein